MARHKDADWCLPGPKLDTWQQVEVAVLMDIRDELKRLNMGSRKPYFAEVFRQFGQIVRAGK